LCAPTGGLLIKPSPLKRASALGALLLFDRRHRFVIQPLGKRLGRAQASNIRRITE
jgi:hypothetical protein